MKIVRKIESVGNFLYNIHPRTIASGIIYEELTKRPPTKLYKKPQFKTVSSLTAEANNQTESEDDATVTALKYALFISSTIIAMMFFVFVNPIDTTHMTLLWFIAVFVLLLILSVAVGFMVMLATIFPFSKDVWNYETHKALKIRAIVILSIVIILAIFIKSGYLYIDITGGV